MTTADLLDLRERIERARRVAAEFKAAGNIRKALAHQRLAEHLEAEARRARRTQPEAGQDTRVAGRELIRRFPMTTTDNTPDDDLALRLATLELLLAMLDPAAPPPDEYTAAVVAALDPVTTEDGRTYVDVGKLRDILNSAVAEARIAERGDKITKPKAQP